MPLTGLDHVQLAAPRGCEEVTRAFFGALLGLGELEKPESLRARGGVWFALADGRQLPGVRRFYADDPWGNRLELVAES